MAIHHDVDVRPHRVAHRGDDRSGGTDGFHALDGHRARHRHAFEGRVTIRHRLLSELGEAFRVVGGRLIKILHLPAAEMAVGTHPIPHRTAKHL